ncbi:MAG: Transcription elongation factor GreA [Alphaproteobacteria bacterium MarineAlpha9_Bin3]|nr:MAG: Transcription elongation factor GreA [Alphaproteobacteria bacterium MarineAlpha9_Bin3]|tara:strand:+ start:7878 stop:8351 length:474 start_codon:yes stop_codon:yes gene_type:complete
MDKVPMTNNSYNLLEEELKTLKSEDRPNVIKAIAEAREHGDLSENAEYHAAKEQQSFIEGRILEIEDKLRRAEVIDPSLIKSDKIIFGATIDLFDENSNSEITFKIVGVDETNVEKGLISVSSPVARSLMGKSVGEVAEVNTPGGKTVYEILKIEYK